MLFAVEEVIFLLIRSSGGREGRDSKREDGEWLLKSAPIWMIHLWKDTHP